MVELARTAQVTQGAAVDRERSSGLSAGRSIARQARPVKYLERKLREGRSTTRRFLVAE
jgi:hypothetical protein